MLDMRTRAHFFYVKQTRSFNNAGPSKTVETYRVFYDIYNM